MDDTTDAEPSRGSRSRSPKPVALSPADLAGMVPGQPRLELVSLAAAREEHRRLFADQLAAPAPGKKLVSSPTGTGKTAGLARAIRDLPEDKWPQKRTASGGARAMRVVVLTKTTAAAEEFVAETDGRATLVRGRQDNPADPFGCSLKRQIDRAAQARQDIGTICSGWRMSHCVEQDSGCSCNYRYSRAAASRAHLVVAPAAAFLNDTDSISHFDVVVVDEELLPGLLETVTLTDADLDTWRERASELERHESEDQPANRGGLPSWHLLFDALRTLLADSQRPRPRTHGWRPALPFLTAACREREQDLRALATDLLAEADSRSGAYPFEVPKPEVNGKQVPLRLAQDLLRQIVLELDRPEGADTRLWLTPAGLTLYRVRERLVSLLQKRALINLDATPNPLLHHLFSDLEEVSFEVPTPIHVTQVLDIRGTREQLTSRSQKAQRLRARVSVVIAGQAADAKEPVIFSFKDLNPVAAGGGPKLTIEHPNVRHGHFGKDERALNSYQDADLVVVVGRHTPPIDHLRAELQAVRFAAHPPSKTLPTERLLPYDWRGPDGSGMGRWVPSDPDHDLDAYVRWSLAATVHQTIGRGRAALRPPSSPLRVLLLTNEPIVGLRIDCLTTLEELGAPTVRRQAPNAFISARDDRNAAIQADQLRRVESAIGELRADGKRVSKQAVAQRAGISRDTLYANQVLRSLVEAACRPEFAVGVGASGVNQASLTVQGPTVLTTGAGSTAVGDPEMVA